MRLPGNSLGRSERRDAVGIGIIARRRGERDIDSGAGQINGGIEGVAAAGQREPAIGAARQFDQHFANANGAGFRLAHRRVLNSRFALISASDRLRHRAKQSDETTGLH